MAPTNLPAPTIRRELRPGDLGAIVAHHGPSTPAEYGVDSNFEAHVGACVERRGRRGLAAPTRGDLDRRARTASTPAAWRSPTRATDSAARALVRVQPRAARAQGLGRRLVNELVARPRRAATRRLGLETFSELRAAAHLYRSHGFELRFRADRAALGPRAGHLSALRAQLPGARPVRNSPSTGSSERPFSVSA